MVSSRDATIVPKRVADYQQGKAVVCGSEGIESLNKQVKMLTEVILLRVMPCSNEKIKRCLTCPELNKK